MRSQVETQYERSQGTSIQQNSMHYLPREGSESNRFPPNLLQIQFYQVLRSLGMDNQVETQKERYQRTSIQQNSMHYLPMGGGWV